MSEIVVRYVGAMPQHDAGPQAADVHTFVPCFQASRGSEQVFKAHVWLTGYAAALARKRLEGSGVEDVDDMLNRALLRYGASRIEAVVQDLQSGRMEPDAADTFTLGSEDIPMLLALGEEKTCGYQNRSGRDLYCTAASPGDKAAVYSIGGRLAAPTSRATCRSCALPDSDFLCSNLLHPEIGSVKTFGGYSRLFTGAICDIGMPGVQDVTNCRASGHECWQRVVEAEAPAIEPISPLGLPESFDVLDALWRLAFGKKRQLVFLRTAAAPATLSLGCTTRAGFESRLSALADVIDKLTVDKDLLPADLPPDAIQGSLDAVEKCLLHQLPPVHHPAVTSSVQTLRRVRQARNAIQHGITVGGGLTAKLRELGIHDAPPNWAGAWDSIRVQTGNAVTIIRNELRQWVDSTP